MIRTTIVTAAGLALTAVLAAAPANAAARDRVFVAPYGNDSNPCTFGSPCKTFQNALSVVAAGGEITAIDSAGFGPVTINKAITITSPNGVEAGIAAAVGLDAIDVQAGSSDVVVLSGLTLEGAQTGAIGINFTSGGELEVVNCFIRNLPRLRHQPVQARKPEMTFLMSNSTVSDVSASGQSAVNLYAAGGSIVAALDHVTINNNWYGVTTFANGASMEVQISDSHIDNNANAGVSVAGSSISMVTYMSSVILTNVTLNQSNTGIQMNSNSTVWLSHVTQAVVPGFTSIAGVFIGDPGTDTLYSDGTNHIMGGISGGTSTAWTLQ